MKVYQLIDFVERYSGKKIDSVHFYTEDDFDLKTAAINSISEYIEYLNKEVNESYISNNWLYVGIQE